MVVKLLSTIVVTGSSWLLGWVMLFEFLCCDGRSACRFHHRVLENSLVEFL